MRTRLDFARRLPEMKVRRHDQRRRCYFDHRRRRCRCCCWCRWRRCCCCRGYCCRRSRIRSRSHPTGRGASEQRGRLRTRGSPWRWAVKQRTPTQKNEKKMKKMKKKMKKKSSSSSSNSRQIHKRRSINIFSTVRPILIVYTGYAGSNYQWRLLHSGNSKYKQAREIKRPPTEDSGTVASVITERRCQTLAAASVLSTRSGLRGGPRLVVITLSEKYSTQHLSRRPSPVYSCILMNVSPPSYPRRKKAQHVVAATVGRQCGSGG